MIELFKTTGRPNNNNKSSIVMGVDEAHSAPTTAVGLVSNLI